MKVIGFLLILPALLLLLLGILAPLLLYLFDHNAWPVMILYVIPLLIFMTSLGIELLGD